MKRTTLLLPLLVLLTLCSCSDNARYSALDGRWLVTSVQDKSSGAAITADGTRYIAFDMELAALLYDYPGRPVGHSMDEYTALCSTDGHTLQLGAFRTFWQRGIFKNDAEPAPADVLALFGLTVDPVTCTWQREGRELTLESASTVIHLTKH